MKNTCDQWDYVTSIFSANEHRHHAQCQTDKASDLEEKVMSYMEGC